MLGYDPSTILNILGKTDEFHRISGGNLMVRCPFPHGYDANKQPIYGDGTTLGIDLASGKWQCFSRCESKGLTITELFNRLNLPHPPMFQATLSEEYTPKPVEIRDWMFTALTRYRDAARTYWKSRGVSDEVIDFYQLGNDLTGGLFHIPIRNFKDVFVGWATRVGTSSAKYVFGPEGVSKATLLFGRKMFKSDFAFGFESIPDVLRANTLGFNAFSTNGVHAYRPMIEEILMMYSSIMLVPHSDAAGMQWAKSLVLYLKGRARLTGTFCPKPYKDFAEMPDEQVESLFQTQKIISF